MGHSGWKRPCGEKWSGSGCLNSRLQTARDLNAYCLETQRAYRSFLILDSRVNYMADRSVGNSGSSINNILLGKFTNRWCCCATHSSFENFEDVVVPVVAPGKRLKLGMRYTESSRMSFIAELMIKQVTQKAIFNYATSLLGASLSSGNGYGFQLKHGVVLHTVVAGSSSRGLLQCLPVVLDDSAQDVIFEYQLARYTWSNGVVRQVWSTKGVHVRSEHPPRISS